MNTITNFLSDATEFVRSHARGLLGLLVIAAVLAGGSYLFRITKDHLAMDRAVINALTKPWAPGAPQPAKSPCAFTYKSGPNTICALAEIEP